MSKIRKPYIGSRRRLVLAIDVGTTFSGVSYAFLEPGEVPKIHGVTRFPGQEHVAGNSKIPSVIFYDSEGNIKAVGAEADSSQNVSQAEDERWLRVELFKLRLRPKSMKIDMNGMRLGPLPPNKSAGDVLGDFLRYLFHCTQSFIADTHANGAALWTSVQHDIHFVLSHPNGWEGAQQTKMRRSAIAGGLIPDTDEGRSRIRFVSEGEASLHACVLNGLAADMLATGNGFIVADAGGGTLDISSYAIKGTSPLVIEEIAPADCIFAGAVFVSRRARKFLEEKLKNSKYGEADSLDHITKRFDETTKRLFRDKNEPQFIPFGSPLDKDLKVGIRGGQLKLTGVEVAELFEPSIEAAVNSIKTQVEISGGIVKAVWLVGGFAANPWLFSQLQERLAPLNVTINRPDTQTSKAVADGAIGFFCDHHVSARMAKYMYGVEYLREMNAEDEDHLMRQSRLLQMPSGPKLLPDAFDCILSKNVRVKESSVFSRKYYTEVTKLSTLSLFEIEIWCYRGGDQVPKWIERHSEHFGSLCHVQADLSKLSDSAVPKTGANGQQYWTIVFSIEIHFGLTEFKARIKWNDNGETRYGPATIVYNEGGARIQDEDLTSVVDDDMYTHDLIAPRPRTLPSASRPQSREISSNRNSRHQSPAPAPAPPAPAEVVVKPEAPPERVSKKKAKGKDKEKEKEKEIISIPPTPIEAPPFSPLLDLEVKADGGKRTRANSSASVATLKSKPPAQESPAQEFPPHIEIPSTPFVPEVVATPGRLSRANSSAARSILKSKPSTPVSRTPLEETPPAPLIPETPLEVSPPARQPTPSPPPPPPPAVEPEPDLLTVDIPVSAPTPLLSPSPVQPRSRVNSNAAGNTKKSKANARKEAKKAAASGSLTTPKDVGLDEVAESSSRGLEPSAEEGISGQQPVETASAPLEESYHNPFANAVEVPTATSTNSDPPKIESTHIFPSEEASATPEEAAAAGEDKDLHAEAAPAARSVRNSPMHGHTPLHEQEAPKSEADAEVKDVNDNVDDAWAFTQSAAGSDRQANYENKELDIATGTTAPWQLKAAEANLDTSKFDWSPSWPANGEDQAVNNDNRSPNDNQLSFGNAGMDWDKIGQLSTGDHAGAFDFNSTPLGETNLHSVHPSKLPTPFVEQKELSPDALLPRSPRSERKSVSFEADPVVVHAMSSEAPFNHLEENNNDVGERITETTGPAAEEHGEVASEPTRIQTSDTVQPTVSTDKVLDLATSGGVGKSPMETEAVLADPSSSKEPENMADLLQDLLDPDAAELDASALKADAEEEAEGTGSGTKNQKKGGSNTKNTTKKAKKGKKK